MEHYGKLALMVLGGWAVLALLGVVPAPGAKHQRHRDARSRVGGSVWAVPVVTAPSAEDNLAFSPAQVM